MGFFWFRPSIAPGTGEKGGLPLSNASRGVRGSLIFHLVPWQWLQHRVVCFLFSTSAPVPLFPRLDGALLLELVVKRKKKVCYSVIFFT